MRIHFAGLDSLRFIAAMMVLISHIESFKAQAGMSSLTTVPFFAAMGQHGVKFFFVLSGFLIGYLLLTEMEITRTIKIKDFYMRRVLRIWPLYFLIVIVGLTVLPQIYEQTFLSGSVDSQVGEKTVLLFLMLPNLVQYMYGHILGLGILWSIGIEEQFYLVFPWVVKLVKRRFLLLIVVIIVVIVVLKLVVALLVAVNARYSTWFLIFSKAFLQFDALLIGALFAFVYKEHAGLFHKLQSLSVQLAAAVVAAVLMWWSPDEMFAASSYAYSISNVLYALPFGVIIVNVATNEQSIFRLKESMLEVAGRWSYGIYICTTQ